MNYNLNLRNNLHEWCNHLENAPTKLWNKELEFLLEKIEKNKICNALITNIVSQFTFNDQQFREIPGNLGLNHGYKFSSKAEIASFSYQIIKYHQKTYGLEMILYRDPFQIYNGSTIDNIMSMYIKPIIDYLDENIKSINYTTYLIEKYKKRVEWFKKNELLTKYLAAPPSSEFEKIFDDDLRLFLFEQGIDYPFSTPSSASGRADIIGNIETEDPIIIEVKVLDSSKKYGINRIKSGFKQIIRYTKDYNKEHGFLILFNIDDIEYNFTFSEEGKYPASITINNKTYYILTIDLYNLKSASKSSKTKAINLKLSDIYDEK